MTPEEFQKMLARRNRGKAASSEHTLQVNCVNWFKRTFPQHIIAAIPNGGYRTKTTAAKMRAEGACKGYPDLLIPIARKGFHSLYIEMKNGKAGRLSEEQKNVIAYLREQGHDVEVVRSYDEFIKVVTNYII